MVKPTLKTLFLLCVCLCSFVLHNSVFYGIDTFEYEETLPLAETRGEQDSSDACTHTHEPEDDMTLLNNVASHALVAPASRMGGGYPSTLSQPPNPLLPPPITE